MSNLPQAPIKRIISHANDGGPVSDEAVRALGVILEEIAYGISKKASELTKHARRKTVTEEDINLAHKLTK